MTGLLITPAMPVWCMCCSFFHQCCCNAITASVSTRRYVEWGKSRCPCEWGGIAKKSPASFQNVQPGCGFPTIWELRNKAKSILGKGRATYVVTSRKVTDELNNSTGVQMLPPLWNGKASHDLVLLRLHIRERKPGV